MATRRTIIKTLIVVALSILCFPLMAAAQGTYDPLRRDRNNGRYDDRNDRYIQQRLRDSIRRVRDRSRDLERQLDSALDRSRYDDTRREDRINNIVHEFREAADDLKNRSNDGRDIYRSSSEARRLLQLGSRLEHILRRHRFDSRVASTWSEIRQQLNVIDNIYDNYSRGRGGNHGRWGRFPF
jgi:hypothetical protein